MLVFIALRRLLRKTVEAPDAHLTDAQAPPRLEAKDVFIEEYLTDPTKTPDEKLVVNIYVPTK